ncbi:MAG: glycosyltransferase family protein [Acidimicrobiales bacterium]
MFLAWGVIPGRAQELAAEVAGEVLTCYPPGRGARPPVLLRYLLSARRTITYLVRRRPAAVVVTNPPIIPAVISAVYGWITGAPVILDDHPGAFGAQGYRVGAAVLPVHRRIAARARLCLVTDQSWVQVVDRWGGHGTVLHESPADWKPSPRRPCQSPPRVLFVCTFARDEPATAVIEAASLAPEMHFVVTGDVSSRPTAATSKNVEFVGFLNRERYRRAVDEADIVMTLTTEPTSAMRAAFEAVWAEKVLVVSDWPLLRSLFPQAVHVQHTSVSIAKGLREAMDDHGRLSELAPAARQRQQAEWADQLATLRRALATSWS